MEEEVTNFENIRSRSLQGHTLIISGVPGESIFRVYCQTCGFKTIALSIEEARFDCRYHGLKTSVHHENIDWDKII